MQPALLCYTRRVPKVNLQRGAWMNVLKNASSHARAGREINRWGVAIAAGMPKLLATPTTLIAQAQPPENPGDHPRLGLNIRTGEFPTNPGIEPERETIGRLAPS